MNNNKLKARMVEMGITQEGLADRLGITVQTLNSKINKKSDFTVVETQKIIAILQIEKPNEIFFVN